MSRNLALVVDQPGAVLEKGTHDTVVLKQADGRRERVGLRALGAVVLHGEVTLSTGVLQAMTDHGVALTMLPSRGRAPSMGFAIQPHRHVQRRHKQHLAYADPEQRLALARRVVLAKIEAMAAFARGHAPSAEDAYYPAMRGICSVQDIAQLMGIEGAATRRHFSTLKALYAKAETFSFGGRSRQPPLDEPNALMSLVYTLAQGEATRAALRAGLDIQLGFLHALHRDRESLSLDLLEPARAEIDAWVYRLLVQQKLLRPELFSHQQNGGVRLTKEGRQRFYPAWFHEGLWIARQPIRRSLAELLNVLHSFPEAVGVDASSR